MRYFKMRYFYLMAFLNLISILVIGLKEGQSSDLDYSHSHFVEGFFPLSRVFPEGTRFNGARFSGIVDLSGKKLVRADFMNVIFEKGANFSGADLSEAIFRNVKLEDINFNHAILEGVNFEGIRIGNNVSFEGTYVYGIYLGKNNSRQVKKLKKLLRKAIHEPRYDFKKCGGIL